MFFHVVAVLQKISTVFTEMNLLISGHTQFKPLLFKGQLYYQCLASFVWSVLLFPRMCIVVRVCLAVPLVWGFTYSHSMS